MLRKVNLCQNIEEEKENAVNEARNQAIFSMLKNAFLYRAALHELKKQPFSANQKVFR